MIRALIAFLFPDKPRPLGQDHIYKAARERWADAKARGDTRAQHWAERALERRMRQLLAAGQ